MIDDTLDRDRQEPSLADCLLDYQSRRLRWFPNLSLLSLFTVSSVAFAALMAANGPLPAALLIAVLISALFLFQLEAAEDRFDDVTDLDLRLLAAAAAIIQATLTLAFHPPLLALLYPLWAIVALTASPLGRRPGIRLALRAGFALFIALFAAGAYALPLGALPAPLAVYALLAAGVGAALEIARGARPATHDEAEGLFSAAWGPARVGGAAAIAHLAALISGLFLFDASGAPLLAFLPAALIGAAAFAMAVLYARGPTLQASRRLLAWSLLSAAALPFSDGLLPLLLRPVVG